MKKSNSKLKKNKLTLDKIAPKALTAIVVVFMALFAAQFVADSNAARPVRGPAVPSIYLSPTKSTSSVGAIVNLELRETSGTVPINVVEVTVDYPAELLELVDFTPNAAIFDVNAEYTPNLGSVTIARGSTVKLIDDQLIGSFNFRVIAKGNATVSVNQSSALVTTDTNNTSYNAAYNIATTPESKGKATIRINR